MRVIPPVCAALALGFGGVALAQPRLVVDPWPRSASDGSAAFREHAPARSSPGPAEIRDPWAPVNDESAGLAHIASGLYDETRDEAEVTPTRPLPRSQRTATWSARFNEIVDPWQEPPRFAASYGAKLIVDPWAPSVRRAQQNPRP